MSATVSFKRPVWRFSRHPYEKEKPTQSCRTPISLSIKQISSGESQLSSVSRPTDVSNHEISVSAKQAMSVAVRKREILDKFLVRKATVDEEYWTAAWLRAESHWEDQLVDRFLDSHKKKFAEQEFYALKRRCSSRRVEKCTCIVAIWLSRVPFQKYQVDNEETNVNHTTLNGVVGTLDINIWQGETFPGEQSKKFFSGFSKIEQRTYGYISNLCVAKLARHHGIASKMLHLAIQVAKSSGVKKVFAHVHQDNIPALQLYEKIGFQIVETSITHLSSERNYLLCIQTS